MHAKTVPQKLDATNISQMTASFFRFKRHSFWKCEELDDDETNTLPILRKRCAILRKYDSIQGKKMTIKRQKHGSTQGVWWY